VIIDKHKRASIIFWAIWFLAFVFLIYEFIGSNLISAWLQATDDNITRIHHSIVLLLTFGLTAVAWHQLSSLNKISRGDFLLRLDNHYTSREIIKARAIIQRLSCSHREEDHEQQKKNIQKKIKKMGRDESNAEDFTYLLNFLDFLETMAYFANENYISTERLADLAGHSIGEYYDLFEDLIKDRRKNNENDSYCELEKFVSNCRRKIEIKLLGLRITISRNPS